MACDACKTIPPVIAEGYEPKGKWEEIAGFKTCVFRPSFSIPISMVLLFLICK